MQVVQTLVQRKEFSKILAYCQKVNYSPEWPQLLSGILNMNPDGAVQFAVTLNEMDPPGMAPNQVVDMFIQRNLIKQVTAYLLDILKNDKEEEGALQTKLLEINLMYSPPQVAEGIFRNVQTGALQLSHYDALKIAQLCEKAQLYQRALENYVKVARDDADQMNVAHIKRVIINTHALNPEWVIEFFGELSKEDSLDCLKEILTHDARRNFKVAVQVATKYSEELEARDRIELFLSFKSYEVLYYYLVSIVNFSKDPEDHFRYIEAVARVGQWSGVERVTRESSVYEPERTMNFLRFFNSICLTYVNCSPYHVPITVLATKKQR